MKHYLIINQSSPFNSYQAQEGIELATALASFEQKVSLLFIQDGCWQLKKNIDCKLACRKNFNANLKALRLSGVEEIYINEADLAARGMTIEDCMLNAEVIDQQKQQDIIAAADIILNVG